MPRPPRQSIGQLLIAGFDGGSPSAGLRALVREFGLGGVILFARNIEAPEQVAELCFEISQLAADVPLWVSVDQEGGRVARLKKPFTEWPPMATLGKSDDGGLAERFARALAAELKAIGITLDYAPVLDVYTNPHNRVIGDRALSEDADVVARLGATIVRALQGAGVAACGKHFPGHGDTGADSHLELPLVEHPVERLRSVELRPFKAAVEAGVAAVMTAHVFLPAIDETYPATLSKGIVTGLLRDELQFKGVVLSDDLEMKAIAAHHAVPEAAVLALGAGCDGVLVCGPNHDVHAAVLEALIHAVEEERLPRSRVEDALDRGRRAKERFLTSQVAARPPSSRALRQQIGLDEHRAIADEMSRYL